MFVVESFLKNRIYGLNLFFKNLIMKVSIAFSGAAWTGIITAGVFLGEMLAEMGYEVVGDKQYESIIKWWNNLFVLYISDNCRFISKQIDHFFYYDQYGKDKNEVIYDVENAYEAKKSDCKWQNTYSVGMAMKILGIPYEIGKKKFEAKFSGNVLDVNLKDLQNWYNSVETDIELNISSQWKAKLFKLWNEIIGEWAIASGLEWYSAYPMTPASGLIEVITGDKFSDVVFFQWEDEIAVSMSMLGAHFAGKRAMCGTSWGWFALMTESISYANIAELGGVYVFAQRAWPSTGTPTFTEQGDLDFALHASFGNTYPIVVAPSTFEDGYNLIWKSLNRSDIYQHPVVYLTDKSFSETYITLDKEKLLAEEVDRGKKLKLNSDSVWLIDNEWNEIWEKFARYSVSEDGISNYSIPGMKDGEFIASSYEHDVYGATSEDPLTKKVMTQKRMRKIGKTFVENVFTKDFYGYEVINPNAKHFYVTFGINRLAIEWILKWQWFGLIVVKVLQPLDPRLKMFFEEKFDNIESLVFVEQNYSGQFEKLIKRECGLMVPEWEVRISNIRKYVNYPFFEEEFLS